MALDGILLSKIKEDIESYLPIRINRIIQLSKDEIVFNIHGNNTRTNLVMSFHSIYNHISLSNKNYTSYNEPNNFVMILRKYLQNGFIYKIEQFSYDRYFLMHIRNRDDLYDEKEYILSIELMGKYANLILIDKETNKIIDALKKIPPYENNKRTILSGAIFTLADNQNKKDPFESNDIDFNESLVKQLQGFSKQLENEVRYRLSNNHNYQDIIKEIKNSHNIYLSRKNDEFEYHIIPLNHLGLEFEKYNIEDGLNEIFYNRDEKERVKDVSEDLFKLVKRQIKHFNTKIIKLNKSLEDALNLEEDKIRGDLLYTYSSLEDKGLNEIEVDDYDGNKTIIKLDPKLSIKANANKYYQVYQKKRKGKIYIDEQIEIAQKQLEYFNSLQEQLDFANYQDSLIIKEELIRNGYLKEKQHNKQKKKKKINLYRIELENNIYITFGKNNLQNDYLTFDYARNDYTWFHAKDYHGAHIVINTDNPNEEMIRICANLAAYYSKGRYSSSVPVDYTLVKNLKKVKGMPSGFVTMKTYKTIYIDPFEDKTLSIISI